MGAMSMEMSEALWLKLSCVDSDRDPPGGASGYSYDRSIVPLAMSLSSGEEERRVVTDGVGKLGLCRFMEL